MFYKLLPDIYYDYGISSEPALPGPGTSFLRGARITARIDTPMVFTSRFTRDNPPKAFAGLSIPIWSNDLVDLFRSVGVDNFECFEATIRAREEGLEWNDYSAVNIVGLVAAAAMSESQYTKIASSPSGLPYAGFHKLVLDSTKTNGLALFRLAENPGTLLAHERIIEAIKGRPRPGGWGITAIPVEET